MTLENLLDKRELEINGIIRKVAVLHHAPYFFDGEEKEFEERVVAFQQNYRERRKELLKVHKIDLDDYNKVYQLVRDYSTPKRSGLYEREVDLIRCKLYELNVN